MPLPAVFLALALQAAPASAEAQPTVVASGEGVVERPVEWVRLGFNLRGEGATPAQAAAALARTQAIATASLRALKGVSLQIGDNAVLTQDVRSPSCASGNTYAAAQQLSVGECAVTGAIATLGVIVRVSPAARAGDVASLAAQVGAHDLGVRGSGLDSEADAQREAVSRAVADARRTAEAMATAAGGRLGTLKRVQDSQAASPFPAVALSGSAPAAPAPPMAIPEARILESPLAFAPAPVTRSAHVTLVYALDGVGGR